MALIRISLNNGKTAILFPEQYYELFQTLLNTAKRDFEVARVTDYTSDGITDADGKVWMAIEFFSVIVAKKTGERKHKQG
jgi:hypothetical protein